MTVTYDQMIQRLRRARICHTLVVQLKNPRVNRLSMKLMIRLKETNSTRLMKLMQKIWKRVKRKRTMMKKRKRNQKKSRLSKKISSKKELKKRSRKLLSLSRSLKRIKKKRR